MLSLVVTTTFKHFKLQIILQFGKKCKNTTLQVTRTGNHQPGVPLPKDCATYSYHLIG